MVLGEPIKNDDIMDNILISSIKDDLVSENEDISFSDEESETSPKKTQTLEKITIDNMTMPVIRLTPGMLFN